MRHILVLVLIYVVELNHVPISRFVCCVWQTAVALPYGHTEGKKCKH